MFETDVNVPSKSNKQKNFFLNWFFVDILEVKDENSRIRIRIRILIRIHLSEAWIRGSRSGSGSTPKCHGSATLRSYIAQKISWLKYFTPPPFLAYYALLRSKQLIFRQKEKILKSSFDILDAKERSETPSDATVPLTALGSLLRGCAGAAPSTSVMLLLMMSLGLSWCCWHAPLLSQQQQNLPIPRMKMHSAL
jgi:hypothetical protein